jgi:hypothetical protein
MAKRKSETPPSGEEFVRDLAKAQLSNRDIAEITGMDEATLERDFGPRLREWRSKGVASVRRELFLSATGKSKARVAAMIYFLKNYTGSNERSKDDEILLANCTAEQNLEQLEQLLTNAIKRAAKAAQSKRTSRVQRTPKAGSSPSVRG